MTSNFGEKPKELVAWIVLGILIIVTAVLAYTSTSSSPQKPLKKTKSTAKEKTVAQEKKEEKQTLQQTSIGKIRVLVPGLNFRSSPEVSSNNIIGNLNEGTVLDILEKRGNWYKVRTREGEEGFVTASSEYVEVVE